MNVLFISSARGWGGGEMWLSQVSAGLRARGHQPVIVCRPDSELWKRFDRSVGVVIPRKLTGDFNPISILRLCRLIEHHKIDLVCTNMEKEFRLAGIAALWADVPIVPSREVDVPVKDTLVNRLYYGHIASALVVNSYSTLNTFLNSAPWMERDRIEVVWKGIDVESYSSIEPSPLRDDFNLSPEDCIVGFVGRLDTQKGIPTLLAATKIAAAQDPRIKLTMAGDGNLRSPIDEFRRRNHLEDCLYVAGFREDIPAFLKAVDFLVLPSYWEGFCYAAVEGMAAGKAVVATHTSSLPEIIEEGRTGLLVPPRSPDALAQAVIDLASNTALRESMGRAGLERVKSHFTLSAMVMKTERVFLRTIDLHHAKEKKSRDFLVNFPVAQQNFN